jgi:hypothetical protein
MECFFVSPVESLLLGFAWGEFLHDKKRHPEIRFHGQVSDRLSPFFPELRRNRLARISKEAIPHDTEWLASAESLERGFSVSTPDRIYYRGAHQDSDFLLCEITDSSRKSFKDLLATYLGDLLAIAPADRVAVNLGCCDDANEITHDLAKGLSENWPEEVVKYAATEKEDNIEGIAKALTDLVAYNECVETFSTGKCLGTLMAFCTSDSPEDQFGDNLGFEQFTATLSGLFQMRLIRRDSVSATALQSLASSAQRFRGGSSPGLAPDFLPALAAVFLKSIQHDKLAAALWIALGETCAFLDDVERVARDTLAPGPTRDS